MVTKRFLEKIWTNNEEYNLQFVRWITGEQLVTLLMNTKCLEESIMNGEIDGDIRTLTVQSFWIAPTVHGGIIQ